jgi:hypothetical protein
MLVHEDTSQTVTLLRDLAPEWWGQPIEVHEAPTRRGAVSYAVRWHGARPALLWEVPDGVRVRSPGLDPSWSSDEPRGEALLSSPR